MRLVVALGGRERGQERQGPIADVIAAVYRLAPPLLFRVDEAVARIQALLAGQADDVAFERCLPAVKADDPLRELKTRSAVASSLIAVLELARMGEVTASQAERDAPILLRVPT